MTALNATYEEKDERHLHEQILEKEDLVVMHLLKRNLEQTREGKVLAHSMFREDGKVKPK